MSDIRLYGPSPGSNISVINTPEFYGAKGDGVTDDAAAFNTMVAAIPDGSWIILGAKTYIIGTQILFASRNNIKITGCGPGSILKIKASSNVEVLFKFTDCTGIVLEDFLTDGNQTNRGISTSSRCGISYIRCDKGIFRNVWSKNSYEGINIGVYGSTNSLFDGVRAFDPRAGSIGHAFDIDSDIDGANNCVNITVTNSYFWGIDGAIKFENVNGIKFVNNYITGTSASKVGLAMGEDVGTATTQHDDWLIEGNHILGSSGITIGNNATNDLGIKIYNNYVEGTIVSLAGAYFRTLEIVGNDVDTKLAANTSSIICATPAAGSRLIIKDNTIRNSSATATKTAIHASAGWASTDIVNNEVINPGWGGIYCYSGMANIQGNRVVRPAIVNDTAEGILLSAQPVTNVQISGNTIYNMRRAVVLFGAQNCLVRGNYVNSDSDVAQNAIWERTDGSTNCKNNRFEDNVILGRAPVYTYGQDANNGYGSTYRHSVSLAVSGLSGATATATNIIPAGCEIIGVTVEVTTLIQGATSFSVGDGTDVDRWGSGIAVSAGTFTNSANYNISSPVYYASATSVVLTAAGSNFTAGAVNVTVHYHKV
jgi:hypothetical protein